MGQIPRPLQAYVVLAILGIFVATTAFLAYPQAGTSVSPVAVIPFASLPGGKDMPWMSQAIADTITTKLGKIHGLKVLERAQVEKALEELALEREGVVEKDKAAKVGKFIGAKGIIIGSYIVTKDDFLHITARLVHVESSEVLAGEQVTGEVHNAGDIFRAIEQLALRLSEKMGYELTEQERQAIAAVPTESVLALEAKTQAQTALNKGKEEEALRHLEEALKRDPDYEDAIELKASILNRQGRWFFSSRIYTIGPHGGLSGLKTPWNPANLAHSRGFSVIALVTYMTIMDIYIYSVNVSTALAGLHLGLSYVSWRITGIPLSSGGMGEDVADSIAVSVAVPLSDALSIGGSVKLLQERLLDETAAGYAFDLGLELTMANMTLSLLATDLPSLSKVWSFGGVDVFPPTLEGFLRIRIFESIFLQGEIKYANGGDIIGNIGLLWFVLPIIGVKAGLEPWRYGNQFSYLIGGVLRLGSVIGGVDLEIWTSALGQIYTTTGYVSATF